jgi:hypothetical protein
MYVYNHLFVPLDAYVTLFFLANFLVFVPNMCLVNT